jgi:hypothetical protein
MSCLKTSTEIKVQIISSEEMKGGGGSSMLLLPKCASVMRKAKVILMISFVMAGPHLMRMHATPGTGNLYTFSTFQHNFNLKLTRLTH